MITPESLRRWIPTLVLLAVLGIVGSIVYHRWRDAGDAAWKEERAVLVARGDSLEAQLGRTQRERDRAMAVADSAREASEREHARAEASAKALAAQVAVTDSLLAALPADSIYTPVIARLVQERDSALALYETEAAAYQTLLSAQIATRAQLTAVEGELLTVRAHNRALTELVESAPGERAWWVPKIVAGYGGVLDDGDVHHGPGALVGLEIRI